MKKIISVSLLALSLCALAYTSEDTSNAHYLADQQIIMKQTIASKYRLDDKILRQEVIAMALKIKGITLPKNYTCKKYFADVTSSNDWVCKAIEIAADNGIITRSNKYANPGKYVTRAEALAMVMPKNWEEFGVEFAIEGNEWQKATLSKYLGKVLDWDARTKSGIRIEEITDGIGARVYWSPNSLATRAEVFAFAKNILNVGNNCEIEGVKVQAPCDISGNKITFGNHIELEIGYSGPECSISYTSGSVQHNNAFYGAPSLIEFYVQSGKIDVIDVSYDFPTSIIMGEKGHYILGGTRDKCAENITFYDARKVGSSDVLAIYYAYLDNNFYDFAYLMRSPAGVSREIFESWYKNTDSVTFREDTLEELDPLEGSDPTYDFLVDMIENGVKSTYKVVSRVNLEKFTIENISSVKQ